MIIEVLFDAKVDLRFFFAVLPLALKEEIGRQKQSLWDELSRVPFTAPGRFFQKKIIADGAEFLVTVCAGKSYRAEDGSRVQQIWVLTIR